MSASRAGVAAVGAAVLTLLVSGCTSAAPSAPMPSSPLGVSSPAETAQQREERLAYEAAEKSYREFRAEYNRVLKDGGSKKPTTAMKRYAGGPYLKETADVTEAFKGLDYHSVGSEEIVFVRRNGYSPKSLNLNACEDSSAVKILDAKKKVKGRGEIRMLELDLRLVGSMWKVWSGSGTKVSSCS